MIPLPGIEYNKYRLPIRFLCKFSKPASSPILPLVYVSTPLRLSFLFAGIASLGSTCAKKFGAALANDVGLGTAIIVAHELAHT